jgi:hypothetical protein
MNNKVTDFPQYRMLSEKKVYYKIFSDKEFVELSWIGNKMIRYEIKATQYPELLRIMDMLACEYPYAILPKEKEDLFQSEN